MSRYQIELATAADDDELRGVLAASPMPGMVSIGLGREPSYFRASVVEGAFRQTLVARENHSRRIVATGARAVGCRYVNGQPAPIGYLSNLRVLPEHRNGTLLARGYAYLRELHSDQRTLLYLTTIVRDNRAAAELLTAGRAGLPAYQAAGAYHTLAISLGRRPSRRAPAGNLQIRRAQENDRDGILDFLRTVGPRRQFFPCYEAHDFFQPTGLLSGLRPEDVWLAFRAGELVGTFALWDQRAFRQIVLCAYGQPLRWLRPFYNGWARLRAAPRLPRPGRALSCLIGALPLALNDDTEVFATLLRAALRETGECTWDCLLVGMHESDPLLPALAGWSSWRFTTELYCVCWDDGETLRRSLDARPPYLELGSL